MHHRWWWNSVCLTVAVMVIGCRTTTQRLEVTQSGTPKFERFHAEYQFEQPDRLLGRHYDAGSTTGRPGVQTVAAESSWSEARLEIESPHPGGDNTLTLVTLTLNERRGTTAFLRKQVRQLTVSRSQVELLISDLARDGFFDAEAPRLAENAQLAIQIDRGKVKRDWHEDARLLDLAHQTLTAGTDTVR